MKVSNSWFYVILLSFLYACEISGVNTETSENVDTTNSGIKENQNINIADNGMMLADTVNGKANEMVYTRNDGLRVEWTTKKSENQINLNDVVMVNFKARVAGGEKFDSNEALDYPIPLKTNIGMMVKGWNDGLLQMHVGDVGRIMIPNALAYGEDGYLDVVPPQADLIIDIEIVSKVEPIILKEGVKVYKYQTSKEGSVPQKNQLITFDYFAYTKGSEGHLYDNSFKNGEPFSFKFENAGVVEGLHQGMSVMKPGENAFIEIPASLAYGSKGLFELVPKNTDIVYDVRVISIK